MVFCHIFFPVALCFRRSVNISAVSTCRSVRNVVPCCACCSNLSPNPSAFPFSLLSVYLLPVYLSLCVHPFVYMYVYRFGHQSPVSRLPSRSLPVCCVLSHASCDSRPINLSTHLSIPAYFHVAFHCWFAFDTLPCSAHHTVAIRNYRPQRYCHFIVHRLNY